MTQSPYGGSASQPMQSTAQPSAAQSTSHNGTKHGPAGGSTGSKSSSSGGDFGATTISGSPRQPGSSQQQSSVATEQRTTGTPGSRARVVKQPAGVAGRPVQPVLRPGGRHRPGGRATAARAGPGCSFATSAR